jgi:hypothetical protein
MQKFRFRFIRWIINPYLAHLLLHEVLAATLKILYFAHTANLFCLLFSEREVIIPLNRNNWLAFVLKMNCVLNRLKSKICCKAVNAP